ncbi:MAG: hypothetical protein QW745_09480 [Thermoplasmata archaeon]
MRIYRQGDVILRKIEGEWISVILQEIKEYPFKAKKDDKLIIKGETGNDHILEAPVYEIYNRTYVILEKPEILKHPEHQEIEIEPGIYQVDHVRDYRGNRGD